MDKKRSIRISDILIATVVILYALACLLPMVLTFMVSITEESVIQRYGYSFFPRDVSFYAYNLMFRRGSSVLNGYAISFFVTAVGTVGAVLITSLCAYTLSNKRVRYRGFLNLFFFIPLVFSSGIVPWYLINHQLGLVNNIGALIIPSLLFNTYNMFLVRNYMGTLPDSLRESATIDGANDAIVAFRIYLPLSLPVIATVTLFYALAYWNDWWNAIMLVDNRRLYPIQYLLLQLKSQISMLRDLQFLSGTGTMTPPTESLKMATAIVTIGPIALLYPFLQRYYVKGLVIGSVKG